MIIIGNGRLLTRNEETPFIENGAVAVEGNVIVDFGTTEDILAKYDGAEFYDVESKLIMPGMINTHHHIYSTFARGMFLEGPRNESFFDILENLWWKVDKVLNLEDVKYSAYPIFIDCIKNGVTTIFDHHASQNYVEKSLFTLADTAEEVGMRGSFCYEVTDRDGMAARDAGIKENIDFIKWANVQKSDMVKGMLGIHAQATVSDETLEKCVEEMGDLDAGYHIHVAEGIQDLENCKKLYGKRVVERLYDAGITGPKSIFVHSIHTNKREHEILASTETAVVTNPQSNMGNAVGRTPIEKLLEAGVLTGLGTDGYTSDMYESWKALKTLHSHDLVDSNFGWGEGPQLLFAGNREIAGRYFQKPLGIIAKDAYADIVVVDYDPITPLHGGNADGHLLFGVAGKNTVSTMINGKFVYKNREVLNVDEKELNKKTREQALDFWKRVGAVV